MSAYGKTVVHYDGSNWGPIYLKDIGTRNQLGGGKGIYVNGQDQYIDWHTDTTFVTTSDVMLSVAKGELKKLLDTTAIHVHMYAADATTYLP